MARNELHYHGEDPSAAPASPAIAVEYVPPASLAPYAGNPRDNDAVIPEMCKAIAEFGFRLPILAQRSGEIIDGHLRLKAAQKLKMETVPVVFVDDLSPAQIRAFRLLINRSATWADWNMDRLTAEVARLAGESFELAWTGFDHSELDRMIRRNAELARKAAEEAERAARPVVTKNIFVTQLAPAPAAPAPALLTAAEGGTPLGPAAPSFDPATGVVTEDAPAAIPPAAPGNAPAPEENAPAPAAPAIDVKTLAADFPVQPGEIWTLGAHRLVCGDCTMPRHLDALMHGEKAALLFTDPPYGMGKESDGVTNDNQSARKLNDFNFRWLDCLYNRALAPVSSLYIWGTDLSLLEMFATVLFPLTRKSDLSLRNFIKWRKPDPAGMNSDKFSYTPEGESCLFLMRGGGIPDLCRQITGTSDMYKHWFSKSQFSIPSRANYEKLQAYFSAQNGFNREYEGFKKDYDAFRREYDDLKREYDAARPFFDINAEDRLSDIWEMERTRDAERLDAAGHATPKPLALCERAISASSRAGDIVLDVFAGSGSTLLAAETLRRRCFAMEIEPRWCSVILARWKKQTGQDPVRAGKIGKVATENDLGIPAPGASSAPAAPALKPRGRKKNITES